MKDVQAAVEGFSSQKEHPALFFTFFTFFYFGGPFLPSSGFGSAFPMRIWIRIQPTKTNADPCGRSSILVYINYFVAVPLGMAAESFQPPLTTGDKG
jgi:hypothetical protein